MRVLVAGWMGVLLVCAAYAAETVPLGAGGYTLTRPPGAKEPAVAPFVTANVRGPVPTNDWWSSLVFTPFSNQMFPHPLGVQAHDKGLRLYYPGAGYVARRDGIFTMVAGMPNDLVIGHGAQAAFPDARVDGWSDWFVTACFAVARNKLRLTFGHGSPFVFGTIEGGDPTFTFGTAPTVFAGNAASPTLGVTVGGRSYGLFGPTGCGWEGLGSKALSCRLGSKAYFSVALLPDARPETLALFARHAHQHVVDTKVTWTYDERASKVTTRYAFTTKAHEGDGHGTIFALYPHQYQRSTDRLTDYTYKSIRGPLRVGVGEGFTTVTPFQGVLPLLPDLGTHDRATLRRYLDADVGAFKPGLGDTYWCGKAMGKLATLAAIADACGHHAARDEFRARLKRLLEDYLTAGTESKGLFYYNRPWGTLIGYPASYGSDESLNDHHFHYGYFVRAAAEIARLEPEWARPDRWGGMVKLLVRDCANPDRNDPLFPFLRNFDVYEGHSWADGKGEFADGNNNESSSEAMNAWTGMILWGALTGDRQMRDAGIYLYVTEKDAVDNYWFDVHRLYPPEFTAPMVSMLWGAKAVYATWFSGDPICMHGINFLPMQSGSLWLGTDPANVKRNVAGLTAARIAFDQKDPKRNQALPPRVGANWGGWGDLVLMYQALADAPAALADCNFDRQELEGGNSRANLYHWVHFLHRVGGVDATVTADTPLASVFRRGDQRTYVAYNPTDRPLKVTFSDGHQLNAAPGLAH